MKSMAVTQKKEAEIFFVGVSDPVEVRRNLLEASRAMVQSLQRYENFKELKNEKEISEDDQFRAQDEVQKVTDEFIKKVDELTAEKEKEILEF